MSAKTTRVFRRPSTRAAGFAAIASFACTIAGLPSAHAEPPRFMAEVERNQVSVGEPFVYQVTLSVGNDQISDFRGPDFRNFRVLAAPAGPNQSTQMQFGGAGMFVQVSYSWRYEIAAAQKGSLTIGPARARVGGQEFRSNAVVVSAVAAGASTAPPPVGLPAAGASGTAGGATSTNLPAEAGAGGSFIRVVTDKQKVFVGEALSATWFLYMNQDIDKYNTLVEPQTEGFWSEDVQVPSRRGALVLSSEVVQGRKYQVGTVLKKALFPLEPGHLTLTPMEAEISRSDFFGNTIGGQRVRSVATAVEVTPLPKAGQPAGFETANVGVFTLSARVDRKQVAVGEAVTLTIEVAGRGNLRKLAPPSIPKLESWKAYEPRVTTIIDPATGVTGTKTVEVLLLPEKAGTAMVPALVLDSFDPDTRRYVRAETAPLSLTAVGDAGAAPGNGSAVAAAGPAVAGGRSTENVLADEIRPLHAREALRRDIGTTFFRTRGFVAALFVPPLGLLFAFVGFGLRDRWAADTGSRRRRRVRQKIRHHLLAADGHRQRGDVQVFFIEIDRVLREALTSRLGSSVKGLRMDDLRGFLVTHGLTTPDIDRVIALLEECDRARFAPSSAAGDGASAAASLTPVLEQANELIDVIEKIPHSKSLHP